MKTRYSHRLRFLLALVAVCLAYSSSLRCNAQIFIGGELIAREFDSEGDTDALIVYDEAVAAIGNIVGFSAYKQGSSQTYTDFNAYILRPTGNPNEFQVVFDSGTLSIASGTPNTILNFPITPFAVEPGDRIAHYGAGIPSDNPGDEDAVVYYDTVSAGVPPPSGTIVLGSSTYPTIPPEFPYPGDRSYSFAAQFTAVPEPHEWSVIAGLGLFGFMMFRRLKRCISPT